MKFSFSIFRLLFAVLVAATFFTSCKKEDPAPAGPAPTTNSTLPPDNHPRITVSTTNDSIYQLLPSVAGQGTWTNPTATAIDSSDGDISSSITLLGSVDPNIKGDYILTYQVMDSDSNTSYVQIHVFIYNEIDALYGNYTVADTCQVSGAFSYAALLNTSFYVNGALAINNFGDFGASINVNATANNGTLSIPAAQSLGGSASLVNAGGNYTINGTHANVNITYTWTDGTSTEVCVSHYTK